MNIAAPRGRLTSRVTPSAVPARIIGTRRRHSARTALRGFSSPTLNAQHKSTTANNGSANASGTKCVASGMVTRAEPKPVMPKISAPKKAMSASSALSIPMDDETPGARAIHAAQLREVTRERQPIARLELLGAGAERAPLDHRGRAAKGERDEVRVVKRRHRQHGAAEGALEALQVLIELRIVVHEIDHQRARLAQREKRRVVELGARQLRHMHLVVIGIDHQQIAALRGERLCAI